MKISLNALPIFALVLVSTSVAGCHKRTNECSDRSQASSEAAAPPPPSAAPAPAEAAPPVAEPASASTKVSQEECVDRWLKAQKLDPYGRPQGTMYAGGSPLFDERTGQRTDRLDFVFRQQPAARKACAPESH